MAPTPTATPTATTTPTPTATAQAVSPGTKVNPNYVGVNPFAGEKLYIDPYSPAKELVSAWSTTRPADAALIRKIANQSVATWLGDWINNPQAEVTQRVRDMKAQGALPVFVIYNIPNRDCGSYSAGGAGGASAYKSWINGLQAGSANTKAVFILEPDAIAGWDCLSASQRAERVSLLKYAITTLTSSPKHYVYIDAGNSRWQSAQTMASRIREIGLDRLTGVSLNVSNFLTTAESRAYGKQISQLTGGLHVVIDTSRNGQGPAPNLEWCNPEGRGLGEAPRPTPGSGELDALLWVKYPGESDGSCRGAPNSGVWMPDYALGLAQRAAF